MIDSVLKGNGNSRFLKSAVPAGTSWADALAMLQAGTFPIDFNGINTEGFQQVGTPLNKANLLKDATAAQIGLPPSATPDGMFQALGNTGELHVWRKTAKDAEDVPAGYNLGVKTTKTIINTKDNSSGNSVIYYSSSVSVSDSGKVSLKNPTSIAVNIYTSSLPIVGKFFYIGLSTVQTSDLIQKKIYFVPSDTDISVDDSPKAFSGVVQEVIGYAKVLAGTTTTYPVSTNPNAYQEGDDAKPAGYVVGDVVNGTYFLGNANIGYVMSYKTATSLSVSDNGVLSMPTDATSFNVTYSKNGLTTDQIKSYFAGKFVQLVAVGSDSVFSPSSLFKTAPSEILFIPSNSVVTKDEFKNFNIDRYQPVTGYAAIPAGTTIEYLGKLGDKARVQVVSYVGTGTYGKDNPNSLTFGFVPKFFAIMKDTRDRNHHTFAIRGAKYIDYSNDSGNNTFSYLTWEGKKISWYAYNNDETYQFNLSGSTYYVLAIG